ncbi:MAG: PspC domain-containing protein [Deltaproteobacteria bacterium]|jgi:phage shock protein C|nr:PspC domain-containing protein [Deltaproteobacteria bacterium]
MKLLSKITLTGPYRSSQGLIFGVARGLAEYYRISPLLVRIVFLAAALFLVFWPMVLLYIVLGIILPLAPAQAPLTDKDQDFVLLSQANPKGAVNSLVDRAQVLEQKIQRLEDIVTSRYFQR